MAGRGRPSSYTDEKALTICERISSGESLTQICKDDDMPPKKTVFVWLGQFEEFRARYAHARETQMEAMAHEILEISDSNESDTQRARLRVDTRKWLMAKLAPKKYGEKLDLNHSGGIKRDFDSLTDEELGRIATGGGKASSGAQEG